MGSGNGTMPDTTKNNWIGFDLGGTKMMAVVYGPGFEALGKKRRKTKAHEIGRASCRERVCHRV